MKNYIIFSLFVLIAIACKNDVVNAKKDDSQKTIAKVKQINNLAKDIKRIDTEQAGLCDTCVASYESVILENRTLAYQMQLKNQMMAIQLQKLDLILDSNRVLVSKAEKIFARNKLIHKKFERLENEEILADTH